MYRLIKAAVVFFVLLQLTCGNIFAESLPKLRIVSITPATTEILFALGLDKEIVGVSSFCSWPLQARKKEKVGSFSNPNIEKIILLKPDLVILTGMEQEHVKNILSSLEIDYINVDPVNLNELIFSIEELGRVTGKGRQSRLLAKSIKETMSRLNNLTSGIAEDKKPRVYMEIWHDPVMCPGKDSFVNDMIETAGGINVTSELKRAYSRIDPEQVILKDPDTVILTYMKPDEWVENSFSKRLGWKGVTAIKNKSIYADIEPEIILRPGPRVVEGLLQLHKRFYED